MVRSMISRPGEQFDHLSPALGILISALTLGEAVSVSLIAGVVLIGIGIRLATVALERAR